MRAFRFVLPFPFVLSLLFTACSEPDPGEPAAAAQHVPADVVPGSHAD